MSYSSTTMAKSAKRGLWEQWSAAMGLGRYDMTCVSAVSESLIICYFMSNRGPLRGPMQGVAGVGIVAGLESDRYLSATLR